MPPEPPTSDREERVNAALAEYLQAAEAGAAPDRAEFLARHADLADELSEFFSDREHLQQRSTPFIHVNRHSMQAPHSHLGDFEIIRLIGRGGMAVVYEAVQRSLQRRVALKVLPVEMLAAAAVARFRREAAVVARLRHPHIVPIFATGEEHGTHYFAMELVDGPSLDAVLRATAAPPRTRDDFTRLASQLADIADALHHAHQHGIIHRDIKPSNLLQAANGKLLVGDFGLARVASELGLTQTGESLGSPAYMSPEQIAPAQPLDHRTDIYSLGVTLFESLTLRRPFQGESREQVFAQILRDEPVPPRRLNDNVPFDLEVICLKSLEKDPRRRYATAAELADDLRRFARGEPIAARPPGVVEQLVRWTKRRRTLAATLAVALIAMMCVLFVTREALTYRATLRAEQLQTALDDALTAALSGDLPTADQAISRAEQLGAPAGRVALLRGQTAYFRGEYDDAVQRLEQAVVELPNDVAAQSMFAAVCIAAGRWEEYEATLAQVEKLPPASPEDYLFRGLAESYLDPPRGLKSLDKAVRLRNWPIARLIRAEVHSRLAQDTGDPADAGRAVDDAKFALEMLPDHVAALLVSLDTQLTASGAFSHSGDVERQHAAEQQAERDADALKRFSHLPLVVVNRAQYLQVVRRDAEALDALRRAADEQPNDPVLSYNLALALYRAGDPRAALAQLEQTPQRTGNGEWLRIWLQMERDDPAEVFEVYRELSAHSAKGLEALFRPCLLLLLGKRADAVAESHGLRNQPDAIPHWRSEFYKQLRDFNADIVTEDELRQAAGASQWDRCEAEFFIALQYLAKGDRRTARKHFGACFATRCYGTQAWDWSAVALARMDADPNWPPWIAIPPAEDSR